MILAILERRAGVKVSDKDVYVSTVGGVRLIEPAADLAIAIAVASAMQDFAVPHEVAAVGELSLAGEIRPVTMAGQRSAEAKRLGYTSVVDSDALTLDPAIKQIKALAARAVGHAKLRDVPEF